MKFLILGLIFGSISYIGFRFGNGYKEKERFYNEFLKFLMHFKTQINFLKTDLLQIINSYKSKDKNFNILLSSYEKNIINEIEYKIDLNILNEEEKNEFLTFFNGVGKSDLYSQIELLDKYIEMFKDKLEQKRKLNLKYGVMYKKLGVLLAFLICIVLI